MEKSLADKIRAFGRTLSAAEVEGILGIDKNTIYQMVKNDRIPGFKLGGKVCFDPYQLADWYEKKAVVNLPRGKGRR